MCFQHGFETAYDFKTTGDPPTDGSGWFFRVNKKPEMPPQPRLQKVCRYYPLALYLSRGFTVDGITPATQTGWKMSGETSLPEMNYHKETKLLIVFGEPNKLKTSEQVLAVQPQSKEDYSGLWHQMKQLQQHVDQLKKEVNPPPPGDVNPIRQRLCEERQKEIDAATNTPAENQANNFHSAVNATAWKKTCKPSAHVPGSWKTPDA